MELAMLLDGESISTVPEQKEYENIIVDCGDSATGRWDTENWGALVTNMTTPKVKCSINFIRKDYKEDILNGTDPVLASSLIPVKISDDGTVTKANIKEEWYNYTDKIWANAVILEDETKTYKNGEIIPESNIESYFVWIPKYKYKIWNLGNYTELIYNKPTEASKAQEIDIQFSLENTKDLNEGECTTLNKSNTSGVCEIGDYVTHPAFTSFGTNGLWVGKFETSGTEEEIMIRANQAGLNSLTITSMFEISYNYQRELDSHMLKNTEWGAITYLSHSKYGINKEINVNNHSGKMTGYSAVNRADQLIYPGVTGNTPDITQPYNTEVGYLASTTGNISGIYDMSGGLNDYVAAYRRGTLGSSGFDDAPEIIYGEKYIDVYGETPDEAPYSYRILGDATGELGSFYLYKEANEVNYRHNSWYADRANFIVAIYPWFIRGGSYNTGILSGQFCFDDTLGEKNTVNGFHIALAFQ